MIDGEDNNLSFDSVDVDAVVDEASRPLGAHAAVAAADDAPAVAGATDDAGEPAADPAAEHEAALEASVMATATASPADTADLIAAALAASAMDTAARTVPEGQPQHAAPAPAPAPVADEPQAADIADNLDGDTDPALMPALDEQDTGTEETPTPTELDVPEVKPSDTAEIDVDAVEARLKEEQNSDPGSTMSFEGLPEAVERIETDSTYDAGTTMSLMWGARSDVGCVRPHNEDSYLVQSPLFCVCDGMGGHAAGEVASSIAVETIAKTAPHTADPTRLAAAVEAANAAIIEAAANGVGKPGMGCTATCAYIEDTTIAIAHVGDSRAYLLHDGTLIRVTRDHSYVEELVDAGEITADEARVHPNRSVITRALGSDPAMYADHFQLNIEEGDRLILCSDGLSSMVPDSEIERIATQSTTAQICVDNLVDGALAAGGSDNVSVIVVDVVDDGRMRQIMQKRKRTVIGASLGFIAALIVALVVSLVVISNNVYLGVKDGNVAVYTGVKASVFGFKLYSLEDETSVAISDLPDDTQSRLKEGIQQSSLDEASDTISKYRAQIDEELTQQAVDAETIRSSTEAPAEADAAAASTDTSTGDTAGTDTADGQAPADQEGTANE